MDNINTEEVFSESTPSERDKATPRGREAAIEIYTRWLAESSQTPLDRMVGEEFRERRYLNSSERRWVAETVYGSVRMLRRQTWLLEKCGLEDTAENRILLWEKSPGMDISDDAVIKHQLPDQANPADYVRITLSFPDLLAEEMEALLSDESIAAAKAFNGQAPTSLRINPLRVKREEVQTAIPDSQLTTYSPWGLELPHRVNIYDMPGFREGWFEIQEEASQLAALLTDVRPEQTVVEIGAGSGGKTLAMAALMQNTGRIFAIDTSATRLEELEKRTQRAGVSNVHAMRVRSDTTGRWHLLPSAQRRLQKLRSAVDMVLLDVPCNGSGILRRSPDTKWRHYDREAYSAIQRNLLEQGAPLVAVGGRLVYVTCSFERFQNEAIIEAFLQSPAGRGFEVEPFYPRLQAAHERAAQLGNATTECIRPLPISLNGSSYMRTWPHRHQLDAFFAASLVRVRGTRRPETRKTEV